MIKRDRNWQSGRERFITRCFRISNVYRNLLRLPKKKRWVENIASVVTGETEIKFWSVNLKRRGHFEGEDVD